MSLAYSTTLNIPKPLDNKIMAKLKNAQTLYPKATKHGIASDAILKGLPLLTQQALVPHVKEKGQEYISLSFITPDATGVGDLARKFNTSVRVILYNALIRGIEHG